LEVQSGMFSSNQLPRYVTAISKAPVDKMCASLSTISLQVYRSVHRCTIITNKSSKGWIHICRTVGDEIARANDLHLQSRYHSHAVIPTDLTTIDATHAGNTHDQIVSLTFETLIRHGKETKHPSASRLFLLVSGVISLRLRALLPDTDKAGLGARVAELPVRVLGRLVVADLALLEGDDVLDGQSGGGAADDVLGSLGGLDVLGGSITLLGLAVAAGEEDEALPVLLKALDVGLEALLGEVLAARVDRDTDGTGELAGDTGGCETLVGS
jgi:hypothetical protein